MNRRFLPFVFALIFFLPLSAQAQQDVSWDVLAQVKLAKADNKFVPKFEAPVAQLQGQEIQIKGFMMPLEQATKQQHFILSANPVQNCFYCLPGGPESLVEVRTERPIEFSYDPITIAGRLELLSDDPMGMYYRLADARAIR